MGLLLDLITTFADAAREPRNWRKEVTENSTVFTGYFLVFDRAGKIKTRVQGRIVEWQGLPTQVFLYDPPPFIKRHRHSSCLQLLNPDQKWFKLHFEKPARDFASAYSYVEHFLTEAYNLK